MQCNAKRKRTLLPNLKGMPMPSLAVRSKEPSIQLHLLNNRLSVRTLTACLQLPRLALRHHTFVFDQAVISEGAKPFMSTLNSAATDGNKDSRELQTQTCLPAQAGHPLLFAIR